MENFNTLQKLFGKYYLGLPLLLIIICFVCYLVIPTKQPDYKINPYENKTDTIKTKHITDETWFWLLLAS